MELLEPDGAFLTLPILKRAFPNGIPRLESDRRALVRERLAHFLEGGGDAAARRTAWLRFLLQHVLDWGTELREGQQAPAMYAVNVPEHRTVIRPHAILADASDAQRARVLVFLHEPGTAFERRPRQELARGGWAASPLEQAERACRETSVPLALLTDGDLMTLLWAPKGEASGSGTFVTSLFAEEPGLLDGFVALLEARRFFATGPDDALEALFRQSSDAQAEVTTTLGRQVRGAVELFVDAIGRADRERNGELLRGVAPAEVYSGAVTVLMRLVFLLSAEERGLFPLGDPTYARGYAVASLREQLREQARGGIEALERRTAAWHRLLALFRAVHGGVNHSEFRLPAYGGSLFDPDRYPFLEGRPAGSKWHETPADPIPVDDRTILGILNELKVLRIGGEARVLSYRTLDVEQIGHVYEGMLDHGCVRAATPVLGFLGKGGIEAEVPLEEAEAQLALGPEALEEWLQGLTKLTVGQRRKLEDAVDTNREQRLRSACDGDAALAARVRPFLPYMRDDVRDEPYVVLPGTLYVTTVSARRDAGAQYTTKELADEVVQYALEPVVYKPGPAEGAPPAEWKLIPAAAILKLKICDPAVGSGAILVAAGRYLAERLMESWADEEATGLPRSGLPAGTSHADDDEVLAIRAVADHCLYGVDRDPLAAEMAKLSLWLTTLSKERPFTFLDHAIQCGDSLLGITSLDELDVLYRHGRLVPVTLRKAIEEAKEDALAAAQLLMEKTVLTVRDAEDKADLHRELVAATAPLRLLGDVVAGSALASCAKGGFKREALIENVQQWVADAFRPELAEDERARARRLLAAEAHEWLQTDLPAKAIERRALHWPLAFPEVFLDPSSPSGFDAMVGNPPFLGGTLISGPMGVAFRQYLAAFIAEESTDRADLVAFFFRRASRLCRMVGMLATNSISQGDTSRIALAGLRASGWTVYRAVKSSKWPGAATLEISKLWASGSPWQGILTLNNESVPGISNSLDSEFAVSEPAERLAETVGQCFLGSDLRAMGFVLESSEAQTLIEASNENSTVVRPYLNGEDVTDSPTHAASRWAINFCDWDELRARQYELPWRLAEQRVKPTVLGKSSSYSGWERHWWQYWRPRRELYLTVAAKPRVLALARVGKAVLPVFVSNDQVFSDATIVFAYEDDFHFGVLTSALHWWWAVTRASTLETRIRYTPTDCFETFPQPPHSGAVEAAGKALDDHRRPLMIANNEGLTKTYNRVHNPNDDSPGIPRLRELHCELDYAVRDAYGWQNVAELRDLDHGFHETSQGVRYTIGSDARTEVLDRLLELNHQRYAEEVAAGLHDKKKGAKAKARQNVSQQPTMLPPGEGE
ncbi:MAG: restriction endonuclease [Dehalococcoidia bacterium]|nr:restriction endonuclease [Dehalococcoidia bacterium]